MIGTLIGAGLGLASSIAGGIANRKARKKQEQMLAQQQRDNQAWYDRKYNDVYVVDLLRRLKAILGEYRQASYKPKPSSMGRKEDTTAQLRDWSRKSMSFLPPQRTQEQKTFLQVMT